VTGIRVIECLGIDRPCLEFGRAREKLLIGSLSASRARKQQNWMGKPEGPPHPSHFIAIEAALSGSSSAKQRW
jgi:hypothetical protein